MLLLGVREHSIIPIGLMASSGLRWQGRYSLPLIAPALVLVLWGITSRQFQVNRACFADRLLPVGLGLMVASLAVSLYWSLIRFSYGLKADPLFPNLAVPHGRAEWVPPNGLLAGGLVAVVGFALPIGLSTRRLRRLRRAIRRRPREDSYPPSSFRLERARRAPHRPRKREGR